MRFHLHILQGLALVFACSIGISCSSPTAHVGRLETDEISIENTTHLFHDDTKPACHLDLKLTYISQSIDERMRDSLNRLFIEKTLGEKYRLLPVKEAMEKYATDYATSYCNDLESTYLEDEREVDDEVVKGWYSYEKSIESRIDRYDKNLLILSWNTLEYTGGPHGIHGTYYTNIDLHLLREIQLKDIFKPDYEQPLTELICKQLMADNQVDSMEALEEIGIGFLTEITPTENFIIGAEGIEFLYNIYEIAPYALGAISVILPYEELKPLLNTDYLIMKEQL